MSETTKVVRCGGDVHVTMPSVVKPNVKPFEVENKGEGNITVSGQDIELGPGESVVFTWQGKGWVKE